MDTPATQADIDRIKAAARNYASYLAFLAFKLDCVEATVIVDRDTLAEAARELRQLASK